MARKLLQILKNLSLSLVLSLVIGFISIFVLTIIDLYIHGHSLIPLHYRIQIGPLVFYDWRNPALFALFIIVFVLTMTILTHRSNKRSNLQ